MQIKVGFCGARMQSARNDEEAGEPETYFWRGRGSVFFFWGGRAWGGVGDFIESIDGIEVLYGIEILEVFLGGLFSRLSVGCLSVISRSSVGCLSLFSRSSVGCRVLVSRGVVGACRNKNGA